MKMLDDSDKTAKSRKLEKVKGDFQSEIKKLKSWLVKQQNLRFLYVPYRDVVEETVEWARRVNKFLDGRLNIQGMAGVVDSGLYR